METRKQEIENQLAAAQQRLTQISRALNEKTEQKDKHEMDLQRIKSKLADLNAIEYPDGNEMEILVSTCNEQNYQFFTYFVVCSL